MKVYIIGAAFVLLASVFCCFHINYNAFLRAEELVKDTADDCSGAAALYYDEAAYADGYKVYNKAEGNKAVRSILRKNLNLNDSMQLPSPILADPCTYIVNYIDETGFVTRYDNGTETEKKQIKLPYLFFEKKSGFKKLISQATVIVTIDAGRFHGRPSFFSNSRIIRTSAYEEPGI